MDDFKVTNIYSTYNNYGYLNIILFNRVTKTGLFFDGFNFYYQTTIISITKEYKEIDYSLRLNNRILTIDSIKESWDIHFIKFNNGDIFQIYFMADDKQHLGIFTKEIHSIIHTPLGINFYDAVLTSLDQAEECEIKENAG
jgi:hypothetical protein